MDAQDDPVRVGEQFDAGATAGFDPQPRGDEEHHGDMITRITSWWHTTLCAGCGHTFRRGDRVRADARTRSAVHLDPALGCAVAADSRSADADVQAFVSGLLKAWPVVGDVPVVRTDEEPYLLRPADGGFSRQACLVCAHSFRRSELVIVCPCSPSQRRCRAAVHRDPGQGLVCWETWLPASTVAVCPVMRAGLSR